MLSEETQLFLGDLQEEEESYETLSLCDLPLYSDQTVDDWEEGSLGSTSISSTSTNEEYFEFYSEELKTPENIIFCGKLIHNKQPEKILNKKDSSKSKKKFSLSFMKLTNMSILESSSSSGKAKWYFMFFGSSRISTEMEWRNVKSRKRSFNSSSVSSSPAFRFCENDDDVAIEDGKGGWGLWGLIKELSCGGNHHPNTMAMVPKSSSFSR